MRRDSHLGVCGKEKGRIGSQAKTESLSHTETKRDTEMGIRRERYPKKTLPATPCGDALGGLRGQHVTNRVSGVWMQSLPHSRTCSFRNLLNLLRTNVRVLGQGCWRDGWLSG